MIDRLNLGSDSHVVEIASNDGYLLQFFARPPDTRAGGRACRQRRGGRATERIPTLVEFFGTEIARSLADESAADLLLGNNVLAHVPDLNDFVAGMKRLLKPDGVITMEFPHLMRLVEDNQWDTIYHEHFSYFSFLTVSRVFEADGIRLFDVEELPTHGGSLRSTAATVTTRRRRKPTPPGSCASASAPPATRSWRPTSVGRRVEADKRQILSFLIDLKSQGLRIAAYGAPAKGNTLLNYCGIGRLHRLHLRPEPSQAGSLPARQSHPDPRARGDPRGEARRRAHPSVEPEGRDHGAASYIREWGGRFAVRTPELTRDLSPQHRFPAPGWSGQSCCATSAGCSPGRSTHRSSADREA